MTGTHRLVRHVVSLIAAVIGFYTGLAAAVAILGLDGASASPLFMSAISGLAAGATLGLFDGRHRFGARSVMGLVLGMGIGVATWGANLDLEWTVTGLAVSTQALALWSHMGRKEAAASGI